MNDHPVQREELVTETAPDRARYARLQEIRDNLAARIAEAEREGWLGEIAGLEATLAAADQKLQTMKQLAAVTA